MTCKNCGSDRHPSEECPALHLTRYLLDQDYEEEHLPKYVSIMDFDELIAKTEDELHDEVVQLHKIATKMEDKE